MHKWILPVLVVIAAGILISLSMWLIRRFCCLKKVNQPPPVTLQNGISGATSKKKTNSYDVGRGVSSKHLFSWSDNPSLVTDAVENGWSRFAFTNYVSSPAVRSTPRSILGPCAASETGDDQVDVEISWEMCQGSADFMQKIRLNSGLKKINTNNLTSMVAAAVIKSALPLPGPPLGKSTSFPQEAYFEITILSNYNSSGELEHNVNVTEKIDGEKIKLIQESPNVLVDELRHGSFKDHRVDENNGVVMFSIGLTVGGSLSLKLPGSYPGSIGFNSDGFIFLDGTKCFSGSEMEQWGRGDKVIGCGYNPRLKRVFFTVNSQLVHEIYCKSEDFETPLYPTLAANSELMVLVNFGQCVFKYAPANLQRTPNPCFIRPLANSPVLGYDDSKELFSMGRIDSQWLDKSTSRSSMLHNPSNNRSGPDFDDISSDADLFEIMLESNSTGRSPHKPL